ncbi:hypothetical protein Dimus_034095 [Dionaea muscipula]
MDLDVGLSATARNLVECRICHDEDQESNLDSPCACRGSLKYAHRKCVQMWCINKGDVVCEICLQQYKPGSYSCPPPPWDFSSVSVYSRGSHGEVSGAHPYNYLGPIVAAETESSSFMEPTGLLEYPAPSSRSVICCRIVTMLFLCLLILRHTLPFVVAGDGEYSVILCTVLITSVLGILCSIFAIVRACTAAIHPTNELRRHLQSQLRFIHIQ